VQAAADMQQQHALAEDVPRRAMQQQRVAVAVDMRAAAADMPAAVADTLAADTSNQSPSNQAAGCATGGRAYQLCRFCISAGACLPR